MTSEVFIRGEPPSAFRFETVGLISSGAAVTVGLLLSAALLAKAEGWPGWLLSRASGETLLLIGSAWLVCAIFGIVCGSVALILAHRSSPRAITAIILSATSLLVVPGAGLAAASVAFGPDHPSDDELIARFEQHESGFEALAHDLAAGRKVSKLELRALGVEGVDRDAPRFFLYVSSWGIVPSGSAKGYLYSSAPPGSAAAGLDDDFEPDGYTYRHLRGPWYLFFETW